MTRWACEGCGTVYATRLFTCPRCHGTNIHEEGARMPKITVNNGPSDSTVPAVEVPSSPGNSSPRSQQKQQPKRETKQLDAPKAAPTTVSPSLRAPTEVSSVPSTAGLTKGKPGR